MRNNNKSRNKVGTKNIAPPNYLIVCEGKETEPNYFNGLKQKMNENFGDRINVVPAIKVKGTGLNTESLVKYTKQYINQSPKMYGQVWVVFDKDDYSDEQFNTAIKVNEYNSAWSNPNFEIWLLSHFKKIDRPLSKSDTIKELKKEFQKANLGNYSKNDTDIFEKITKDSKLETAIENCKEMYKEFNNVYSESNKNPCTTVFMLVEDLSEYLNGGFIIEKKRKRIDTFSKQKTINFK